MEMVLDRLDCPHLAGGSALDDREALPAGTLLDGSYRVTRVVGSGGFAITYAAEDVNLGTVVAIKEYYPFDFGERVGTMSVRPKSERHRRTFEWGRTNFLEEARTLARFEHSSIVRVARVFEAGSTAYMVMRFERGHNLEDWLRGLGRPPTQQELDRIVAPLLEALQMLHAEAFLHRDIAPDNIIVREDGTPVLLDFGAARRSVVEMSGVVTGVVKAGYSPHEQYSSDGRLQGPWTDLYALGGTLYRAVAGRPPEEAALRVDEDYMAPAIQVGSGRYRRNFLEAIDACLKVKPSQRPRSVAQVRPMLLEGKGSSVFDQLVTNLRRSRARLAPSPGAPSRSGSALRQWFATCAGVATVLAAAYLGYEYTRLPPAGSGATSIVNRDGETDMTAKRRAEQAADLRRKEIEQEQLKRQAALDAERRLREAEESARRQAELEAEKRREAELAQERARLSEKFFVDCEMCPQLVPVRGGEYLMGSSKADIDAGLAANNEGPQRNVRVPQALAVGRFEVTRDQYEAFVQATGREVGNKCWTMENNEPKERDDRSFRNPGYAQAGNHPAVCINWQDAKAYADWLSMITGKRYGLLSEAQWEYVARAGNTGRYSSGNAESDLCAFGNGADRSAGAAKLPANWDYLRCDDRYVHTAPVGSFKANGFGIFDLMGNAWEWTQDCYADSIPAQPADGNSLTALDCQQRTVRGGAWSATARMLRVTVRGKADANLRFDDVGFRVQRTFAIDP